MNEVSRSTSNVNPTHTRIIVTLSQGMVVASPLEVQGILKQGAAVLSANNFLLGVLESSTNVFRSLRPVSFFCDMGWPSGHGQVTNPGHPLVCHGQVAAHRKAVVGQGALCAI